MSSHSEQDRSLSISEAATRLGVFPEDVADLILDGALEVQPRRVKGSVPPTVLPAITVTRPSLKKLILVSPASEREGAKSLFGRKAG